MKTRLLFPCLLISTFILLLGCPNPVATPTDTVINITAIPGITAPVFGETPVTAIIATDQYTGTIAWNPTVSSSFAASTTYTATITLTAKPGYTLAGVTEGFFTVAGASSVTNAANSGIVEAVFPATGVAPDTVINITAIPGITAPVFGETPVTAIIATDQYTGTIAWNPTVSSSFAASTTYTATITLTAKPGYTLAGVTEGFFTVAGASSVTNAANSGIVEAVFPATGVAPDTVINITAIPGITAPVFGETPVTAIIATDQYTGTIAWNPTVSSSFAASTTYTATITLTAKPGYTLAGVTEGFFTVAGASSVTNAANSGIVEAVFPATGVAPDTVINITAIPGITAPVFGETPVTAIIATDQYTGTIAWNPTVSSSFAASTTYTATITLTAKPGYTLAGVTEGFFTVAGASSVTNAANSGIVEAVFPATGVAPDTVINITAIPGITAPVFGETPVTAIIATDQYTGTIAWNPTVSSSFAASTTYTATITLTAKPGYTLAGVTEGFFTVAGASSVTNAANSGIVEAVFPQTAFVPIYSLRDIGPAGGIIFYINPNAHVDGWSYLEAWIADEVDGQGYNTHKWYKNYSTSITTNDGIGTGFENTYSKLLGTDYPAAELTRNANHGGYTDWYLPSKAELNLMYTNLHLFGYGNFITELYTGYWSSSRALSTESWGQSFTNGLQNYFSFSMFSHVRSIRKF